MSKDELTQLVDLHVCQLREHVDSVRIFVTVDMDEGKSETFSYDSGSGNFYAQLGQISEWLMIQKERATAHDKKED